MKRTLSTAVLVALVAALAVTAYAVATREPSPGDRLWAAYTAPLPRHPGL